MSITRQIILEKLTAYLSNKISKQEVYEWALAVAVSGKLESTPSDSLLRTAVKAMIEMNHSDLARVPTRKALEYYRRCLAGELEFIPLEAHKELHKLDIPEVAEEVNRGDTLRNLELGSRTVSLFQAFQEWEHRMDAILTARLYVIIFAICSVAVQISSLLSPGFMQIGLLVPSRWDALLEAFPHLVYAYIILLPPRKLVPTKMFILALPFLVMGVVFYWTIAGMLIAKLSLPWIALIVFLPFSAIPAALALALVVIEKWGKMGTDPIFQK